LIEINADGGGRTRKMTRQTHGLAAKTGFGCKNRVKQSLSPRRYQARHIER
jgi:hypothetical protein